MFLVFVLVLFPLVFLLNPRLAFVGLIAAIAWHVYGRTGSRTRRPRKRSHSDESPYQPGYEN